MGKCPIKVEIQLTDETPLYCNHRRLPFVEQAVVKTQVEEWVNEGVVRTSTSPFSSPVVVTKKKDGTSRICIDYRRLNKKIIRDHFPVPLIEDQLDRLQKAYVFSTLDLKNGFFHVPIEEKSKKYTAFVTYQGQFEFNRVPFGLCICILTIYKLCIS